MQTTSKDEAVLLAGVPLNQPALYRRIRFLVGDPAALIELGDDDGRREATLIVRDIEMQRARQYARADHIACPKDFAPTGGLSGDRETATAQATAELLRRNDIQRVLTNRALPLIFAHYIQQAGIEVQCDVDMGVLGRRAKDEEEVNWLREAQRTTEGAMQMACELVAGAQANADGELTVDGAPLTSDRVRAAIDIWLMERNYMNPTSIVAGGSQGADCHREGDGPLRTGQSVIIDIFPQNRATRYCGDCTRTVVHGEIPERLTQMHAVVVQAKAAAEAATRAGVTGQDVHAATTAVIQSHGYKMGLPPEDAAADWCGMPHGTGHGIGLEVHEPPLLDAGGPELVVGDALTIEPGLYVKSFGGVRVEDMVIVTDDGCENLNSLPEGLTWS